MSFKDTSVNWKEEKLVDVTNYISRGITPKYTDCNKDSVVVVNQRCIRDGVVSLENARRHDLNKKKVNEDKYLRDFDILVNSTGVGTLGRVSQIHKLRELTTADSHVTIVRGDEKVIDKKYLGYSLKLKQPIIENMAEGSTGQTELSRSRLGDEIKIQFPESIIEQKEIAHILSTLDEKIEVNNRINKTLEEMAQAIFKHWFVDFEFPNEDGEPYKSSGGEMVDSELGPIPKGWEVESLKDVIELYDSKRVPLSGNVRDKMEKIYPYYGAASLMDYVDDYIFDGIYVLLGEDGTVVTDDGSPVLQYVWGKFWVNNHAHVISGKKEYSVNFVYNLLKNMNVSSIVTGAVQKKINQKNLISYKVVLPKNNGLINTYTSIVEGLYKKYRLANDENKVLASIRDTLLPKLMSGEIRVPLDNKE